MEGKVFLPQGTYFKGKIQMNSYFTQKAVSPAKISDMLALNDNLCFLLSCPLSSFGVLLGYSTLVRECSIMSAMFWETGYQIS